MLRFILSVLAFISFAGFAYAEKPAAYYTHAIGDSNCYELITNVAGIEHAADPIPFIEVHISSAYYDARADPALEQRRLKQVDFYSDKFKRHITMRLTDAEHPVLSSVVRMATNISMAPGSNVLFQVNPDAVFTHEVTWLRFMTGDATACWVNRRAHM